MERNSFSHQDSFQLLIEFSGARTTSRKSETQERSSLSGHVSHFSDQPHCAQHDLLQHRWDKPGKRNGHVSLFPINCDATRQDKTRQDRHWTLHSKKIPNKRIVSFSLGRRRGLGAGQPARADGEHFFHRLLLRRQCWRGFSNLSRHLQRVGVALQVRAHSVSSSSFNPQVFEMK
jgi:hypothetical protein